MSAYARNAFHDRLTRYNNGAFASRANSMLALAAISLAYRQESAAVLRAYRALSHDSLIEGTAGNIGIAVPPYAGGNPQAQELMGELRTLSPFLAGACAHGSIGTGEEIAYSDFDALVILRHSAFQSAATLAHVAARLGALRRLMFEFDPLQHHGWFVLTESDLTDYCEAWFPTVLFAHSRALFPDSGMRLVVRSRDSTAEYRGAFDHLCASVLRQIEAEIPLDNAYRLKGLLSEFMLLPSLYLQARDGVSVFKRKSFDLAAGDFPPQLWSAMERVSAARLAWSYEASAMQRYLLTRCVAQRRLVTRMVRLRPSAAVRDALSPDLWETAAALVRAMQVRLRDRG
jgi:hypothetical protein